MTKKEKIEAILKQMEENLDRKDALELAIKYRRKELQSFDSTKLNKIYKEEVEIEFED
jgi:hypothetical protein